MKNNIYTIVQDIQYQLTQRDWVTSELGADIGQEVSRRLIEQFRARPVKGTLRLSRMGPQCPCALWYSVHHPEMSEPLPPWAENKYSFGHIVEAWTIALAKASGHSVTGEQDEVSVDGILGHRDCVIDGCIVDVKSANSRSFKNWKAGMGDKADDWGYLSQLDGYVWGSREDPLVLEKEKGYLLLIDKELGHMHLHEHHLRKEHIRERISAYKSIVNLDKAPPCECRREALGSAGNIGLAYPATYNSFKFCCCPTLRTCLYSSGPVYFTKVVQWPTHQGKLLAEVDKTGKVVYN